MIALFVSGVILLTMMVGFVQLYTTKAVELDVRSSLSRQITSLSDAIVEEDNDLVIDEKKIERNFPNMYVAIIDYSGKVLWGSTPEGDKVDSKQSIAPREIIADGYEYYYIDRNIEQTMDVNEFVRAYVRRDDIMKKYLPFKFTTYGITLAVFVILTFVMHLVFKRFRRSLIEVQSTVEKIGVSKDFDHRLNPDEHYKEIASLIEADNRMLDSMQEMFRQQEQFSSDVAHELRTPISVIKAECQYVLNNLDIPDEQREYYEVILRQSNKMQELVSTLLELSRLDAGDTGVDNENVDLNEIVGAVYEAEQDKQNDKKVSFEIKSTETSVVNGDIGLVTIAVSNLIANAVKFSPDNSVVYIETGENEDYVFAKVRDEGIGMTEEEQKQVFTRFYKSDSSRNSGGYGLGMPLAMKIAENHGGTVTVESESEKGSCFTIYLKK